MTVFITFIIFTLFAVARTRPFYSGFGAAISMGYFLKFGFAAIVAIFVKRRSDINTIIVYSVIASLLSAFIMFVSEGSRRSIFDINTNLMGFSLVIGCVLLLVLVFSTDNHRVKYGVLSLSVPLVVGIILTGSRGSYLMLGGVLLCVAVFMLFEFGIPQLSRRELSILGVATGVVAILVAFLGDPVYYFQRIQLITEFVSLLAGSAIEARSLSIRFSLYRLGIQMFSEHPLIGYGFGTFPNYVATHPPLYSGKMPHSLYISILSQLGIVGMVLLLVWLLSLFRLIVGGCYELNGVRESEYIYFTILGSGFVGILVQGAAVDVLVWKPTWLLLGLLVAHYELTA